MTSITAAVITLDEAANVRPCLDLLGWADEILVVDAFSRDDTPHLAGAAGARVMQRPFDTFARQRNYALDQARGDWVFFVDADERVDVALAQEVRAAVEEPAARTPATGAAPPGPAGFWVPRRNLMLGRWVRHGGWWPDYQLRVLHRGRARYDESRDPHEVVVLDGSGGYLEHPIVHHNYASVRQIFAKQATYARRETASLARQGERSSLRLAITRPLREFHRRYVALEGYRDGPIGLLLASAMAWYWFRVYLQLRAQQQPPPAIRSAN